MEYQKTGGILHLKAALVSKAEAEQIFWDKCIDIAPIFEGEKTALTKLEANLDSTADFLPDPFLIWQVIKKHIFLFNFQQTEWWDKGVLVCSKRRVFGKTKTTNKRYSIYFSNRNR